MDRDVVLGGIYRGSVLGLACGLLLGPTALAFVAFGLFFVARVWVAWPRAEWACLVELCFFALVFGEGVVIATALGFHATALPAAIVASAFFAAFFCVSWGSTLLWMWVTAAAAALAAAILAAVLYSTPLSVFAVAVVIEMALLAAGVIFGAVAEAAICKVVGVSVLFEVFAGTLFPLLLAAWFASALAAH